MTKLRVATRNFGNAPNMKVRNSGNILFFESVIYYDYIKKGFCEIAQLGQQFQVDPATLPILY